MRQTAFSKLISERVAPRTSPGRAKVRAQNFNAALIVGHPSYSSIPRRSPPNCSSSVIAARGFAFARSTPLQRGGGVAGRTKGDDRQPKNGADDAAQPAGGLASAALLDSLQKVENFGGCDLGDRAIGERCWPSLPTAICFLPTLRALRHSLRGWIGTRQLRGRTCCVRRSRRRCGRASCARMDRRLRRSASSPRHASFVLRRGTRWGKRRMTARAPFRGGGTSDAITCCR